MCRAFGDRPCEHACHEYFRHPPRVAPVLFFFFLIINAQYCSSFSASCLLSCVPQFSLPRFSSTNTFPPLPCCSCVINGLSRQGSLSLRLRVVFSLSLFPAVLPKHEPDQTPFPLMGRYRPTPHSPTRVKSLPSEAPPARTHQGRRDLSSASCS